jgi:hypothetical protein
VFGKASLLFRHSLKKTPPKHFSNRDNSSRSGHADFEITRYGTAPSNHAYRAPSSPVEELPHKISNSRCASLPGVARGSWEIVPNLFRNSYRSRIHPILLRHRYLVSEYLCPRQWTTERCPCRQEPRVRRRLTPFSQFRYISDNTSLQCPLCKERFSFMTPRIGEVCREGSSAEDWRRSRWGAARLWSS